MKSSFQYVVAACAMTALFSGCEWGGAHDNTWNDAYNWANFTGTYRFVKAVVVNKTTVGGGSSGEGTSGGSSSESTTTTSVKSGSANAKMSSSYQAGGTLSASSGIVPGSVHMTITTSGVSGSIAVTDDSGALKVGGMQVGSIDYASGSWSITQNPGKLATAGSSIAITYQYKVVTKTESSNGGSTSDSSQGSGTVISTINLSYLNVIQKGNSLTMTGDNGVKYTGRLTGASMGASSYTQAQSVSLSFEVSNASGDTIVGNFTGTWSGAADLKSGTMTDRRMAGTHSRAGNFVGVAANMSIDVSNLTIGEYDSLGNVAGSSSAQ